MITTTLTDFRKEMKSYLDRVVNDMEKIIINRGKDKGVVMMSVEEYNEYLDLQNKSVRLSVEEIVSLDEGIKAAKKGVFATSEEVDTVLNRYAKD